MFKSVVVLALAASAYAFAPASRVGVPTRLFMEYGKYDDQLWDNEAKKDVYASWDPNSPRSPTNFNPFENDVEGNSPDASGFYPGEGRYKDPQRPDVNFAIMQAERAEAEERAANPKPGDVPGCPGCKSGGGSPGGGAAPAPAPVAAAPAWGAPAAPAPAPAPEPVAVASSATAAGHIGAGGMADTRDPDAYVDEDPRKSISAAPSFEEYMKSRQ